MPRKGWFSIYFISFVFYGSENPNSIKRFCSHQAFIWGDPMGNTRAGVREGDMGAFVDDRHFSKYKMKI